MTIDIKHHASFTSAVIRDGHASIDLGMMDDKERDEVARTLVNAAFEIGPTSNCMEWFISILSQCDIELERKE